MNPLSIAVIYYSATGNVDQLARTIAEGAADAGAEVRPRRVAELAPAYAIDTNPAWRAHLEETKNIIEEAQVDEPSRSPLNVLSESSQKEVTPTRGLCRWP